MLHRSSGLALGATAFLAGCAHLPSPEILGTAPSQEVASQLYGAIWYDLESNAMIGNGNEIAALWANAKHGADSNPERHIQSLSCSGNALVLHCTFGLLRDGGPAAYNGSIVPDRLVCGVKFTRSGPNQPWSIPRLPPPRKQGHSRITIKCTVPS